MRGLGTFLSKRKNIVKDAINFGKNCPVEKVPLTDDIKSLENLDKLLVIVKDIKTTGFIDDNMINQLSTTLGVLLGEMIIKEHKCKWCMDSNKNPILDPSKISTIEVIKNILNDKSKETLKEFYEKNKHHFWCLFSINSLIILYAFL